VVDYLVEEVLDRQTDVLRTFLLQTSILDRLNGSLCDAVTGAEGSGRTLEAMERANLFVVPLDANRRWYRYHQLFAEALEARLLDEWPRVVPGLHGRASDWYERNGMPADAIRHALTARDFERAAGLTESAWPGMEESARSTTWLTWVRALPDDVVRARPVLDVAYAYALLGIGAMEDAEARLTAVERRLQSGQAVVASEEGLQVLSATIAIGRAYHAQAVGDPASTVKHAREALDLLPDGDALRRGQATALLGLTAWADGDLETADAVFADYASQLQALDDPDAISATFVLAEIRTALGRLREASATLEQSIQLATRSEPIQPEAADLYRALAELHLERGALDEAEANLSRAAQLGQDTGLADWNRRLFVARARMEETLGNPDAALVLLDEAERLSVRTPLPDVRPVSAMRARIWIRQGRLTDALDWARSRGLSTGDPPSYLREYEHLTFARALVGQHSIDETMGLLDRLLAAAEAGSRTGTVIEILVVQALAHEAQHATPRALTSLKRALELAEPEGYVRLFVDEGPPVERLLHEATARGVAPDYARGLLAAFTQADSQPATPQLLSDREREVLQHIAEGLTNRQIADRLFLSEFTVKAHARSIYGQLEVSSRTQAVARARELGILPQG
jgi:LuxR family maltose regulon positive regulatory protein